MFNRIILLIVLIPSFLFSADFQISQVNWTNVVDNDGDDYTSSRSLVLGLKISEGVKNIKVRVQYTQMNGDIWLDGPVYGPTEINVNFTLISIDIPPILENGYGIFKFRLELLDADNSDIILKAVEPEGFDALNYQLFENVPDDYIFNGKPFIVTTSSDDGQGSFREAIKSALNISPDNFHILFNIPRSDSNYDETRETWSIVLKTPLDKINNIGQIIIDGYTQPYNAAKNMGYPIVIQGKELSAGSAISIAKAGNVFFRGLQVLNFRDYGIELEQVSGGAIYNCIIGTDPLNAPNIQMKAGIYLFNMSHFSLGTVIIENTHFIGNHFVGNQDVGILLMLCSNINVLANNFGNINFLKEFFVPANINVAIQAQNNSNNLELWYNRFADNGNTAIQLISAVDCLIHDNFINTDTTWARAFGGYEEGIKLIAQSTDNFVSSNTIGYCSGTAITIDGDQNRNKLSQNSTSRNGTAIQFLNSQGISADLTRIENNILYGLAGPGFDVEVFGDENDQARVYLGSTTVDNGMEFSFNLENLPTFPFLTATVTDLSGNTGYLSLPISWKPNSITAATVTNTMNDGEGSLRAALTAAKQNVGPDTVRFNIPRTDPGFNSDLGTWDIFLSEPIYITDDNLIIDGYSQREFIGEDLNQYGPEIVVDGSQNPGGAGLYFLSCDSLIINDLVVTNFGENIYLMNVTNAEVKRCYLGTGPNGQVAGKTSQNGLIANICDNLVIGSDNINMANVISGNITRGVLIDSCRQVVIQNNKIGIDRTGCAALSNDFESILVQRNSNDVHILHNHIGGELFGIRLIHANNIQIANNIINTDSTIQQDLGNGAGIILQEKSNNNKIEFNTISFCDRAIVIADTSLYNPLNRNIITNNSNGIILNNGGNKEIKAPALVNLFDNTVEGTSGPGNLIQLFADDKNQGRQYLGETNSDDSGAFSFSLTETPGYPWITAIATDNEKNSSSFSFPAAVITSVNDKGHQLTPQKFKVSGCYPNPFNPETNFEVSLPVQSILSIDIFNLLGRHVRTLYHQTCPAGIYSFTWNGKNNIGLEQTSGTYFIRVQSEFGVVIQKIILLK